MPNLFGQDINSVEEITDAFRRHGDAVRMTYRARYVWDESSTDPYAGTRLERPAAMIGNPPAVIYPWEQVFVSAASCAGSDFPMLAKHFGVRLERVEFVVEGVFDPRGEFAGLTGLEAPADAAPAYVSLHLRTTVTSDAAESDLRRIHRRVVDHNMVLGALRGIPRTDRLEIERPAYDGPPDVVAAPSRSTIVRNSSSGSTGLTR